MNAAPPVLTDFARRLLRELRALGVAPADEKPLIVAVSGGADSAALFAGLAELKFAGKIKTEIVAAHFNHKLRGAESDADAEFVAKLAKRFDGDFALGAWDESENLLRLRDNLEQAARRARYNFLATIASRRETDRLLVAHTLDDQAETVLMRLLRGSSAEGLAAMKTITKYEAEITNLNEKKPAIRNSQPAIICRPLLAWARREMTENYCRTRQIDFRTDAMNLDSRFMRVRVRRELLPLLKTFNPKIVETLARTACLLGEDNEELNEIARTMLENADFTELKTQSSAIRRRVLRNWLKRERGGTLGKIENKHLLAIDRLFLTGAGESRVEIPGGAVVKKNGKLLFKAR
jgi:tRNA(Ile)-lysidine synthase